MPGAPLTQLDQLGALGETRARTLALVADLSEEQLSRVVTPLLSPLIWDLGHIANFEQRWLLEDGPADDELAVLYDPFKQPRAVRGELPVLDAYKCFDYMNAVRDRVEALGGAIDPFSLELVIQHEQQHNETMLQLLRMMDDYAPSPDLRRTDDAPAPGTGGATWVEFPGGDYLVGTPVPAAGEFAYDNESGEHSIAIERFEIARRPVLNGEYREWVEAGGTEEPPPGWVREGGDWFTTGFGDPRPLEDHAPVVHVNWFEAAAYARAHQARLPSEFEWEVAASYDAAAGSAGARRELPWGAAGWRPELANLDQLSFGTRVCSAGEGQAPVDMAGQVWEWTASEFGAYPGFSPFAYERYSAPFFDSGYRVLRGGSWATRPRSVDNRFRNWDLPERRQIFAGFRLARD